MKIKFIFIYIFLMEMLYGTTVTTNKQIYNSTEVINVSLEDMSEYTDDWVAIYKLTDSTDWSNVLRWKWVPDINTTLTFNALPVGEYVVRAFFNNKYQVIAEDTFVVEELNNKIGLDVFKKFYYLRERPRIRFFGVKEGEGNWIAIYPKDSSNDWSNVLGWRWLGDLTSTNDLYLNHERFEEGEYEVRLFYNNKFKVEAKENFFVQKYAPRIEANQREYTIEENITVHYYFASDNPEDWIGIYPLGSSNEWKNVKLWKRTDGVGSNRNFLMGKLPAGKYEVRGFLNNSFDVEARNYFNVVDYKNLFVVNRAKDVCKKRNLDVKDVLCSPVEENIAYVFVNKRTEQGNDHQVNRMYRVNMTEGEEYAKLLHGNLWSIVTPAKFLKLENTPLVVVSQQVMAIDESWNFTFFYKGEKKLLSLKFSEPASARKYFMQMYTSENGSKLNIEYQEYIYEGDPLKDWKDFKDIYDISNPKEMILLSHERN